MISIDIHRQRFSKNWRLSCRFVLSSWGNYRELTVFLFEKLRFFIKLHITLSKLPWDNFKCSLNS